jgi:two-component system, OmpR family, sensor kinase
MLACLFAAIVFVARRVALGQWHSTMRSALEGIAHERGKHFDLVEFREAHPELSISVYDLQGSLIRYQGPVLSPLVEGFQVSNHRMHYGQLIKSEWIIVGGSWRSTEEGLERLTIVLAILWLPLSLLVGATTWLAAKSIFDPLVRLNQQATAISGTNLSQRLATGDRGEFGEFARQLNLMLDRIQQTAVREEQFASDAAHELRTPLSILRTRIETTLLRPRTPEEYENSSQKMLLEIDRLTRIVESLLETARGEQRALQVVELEEILKGAAERWQERFDSARVDLVVQIVPIRASIPPDELNVVFDNLLDNALRFSPPHSIVLFQASEVDNWAVLAIQDSGTGIPSEMRESVFERFVRVDDDRNRNSGGAGIGLSVCRKIVHSRHGEIHAEAVPGGGTRMVVRLPLAADAT